MSYVPRKKRKSGHNYKSYLTFKATDKETDCTNRHSSYKPYLTSQNVQELESTNRGESSNAASSTLSAGCAPSFPTPEVNFDNDDENATNSFTADDDGSRQHSASPPSGDVQVGSDVDSNYSEAPDLKPLFEGSNVDVDTAIGSVLDFYISHNLSKLALNDLLTLIQNLIPKPNLLPTTKYKLDQYILQNAPSADYVKHYYCLKCHNYIGIDGNESVCNICGCEEEKSFFLMYDLKSLLKNFLENGKVHKYLKSTESLDPEMIGDIHDGRCLRQMKQTLQLGSFDLNMIWNTDGVPVFKSSKSKLWPLQFTLSEIPPELRSKYVMVAGIWYGTEKPDMNTFLKPFAQNLVDLSLNGLEWCIPGTENIVKSRVFAPIACLDAPARASVINMHQFNGEFGCNICEKKGTVIPCGRGTSRIYRQEIEDSPLRTDEEMKENASEAVARDEIVKGVKGPSILNILFYFNIAQAFVPDYMHCVLLGVVRQFLFLWLNPSYKQLPWSLSRKINLMNTRLKEVKPPSEISRIVRSLHDRKYWKASEYRSWLLFYSLPTLSHLLPDKYFQHWILLVFSIFTMLKDKVSNVELRICTIALKSFCKNVENLYGTEQLTFNVHQLTHLPLSVARWGPLWATSAFMFENNNGTLLKLIHGTQNVSMQIINSFKYINGLCVFESKIDKNFLPIFESNPLICPGKVLKSKPKLLSVEKTKISTFLSQAIDDVDFMSKCRLGKTLYTSLVYVKSKIRNNCTVMYKCFDKEKSQLSIFTGFIKIFFKVKGHPNNIFCVIKRHDIKNCVFKNREFSIEIDHLKQISLHHVCLDVVPVQNLIRKLVYLNKEMVGVLPNPYEMNL